MVFYFSGTGNSYQVAKSISESSGEALVSIADNVYADGKDSYEFELKDDESIGFVFPVHAWGPPPVVRLFIERLKLTNHKGNFTYSVVTCGDNIGKTMIMLEDCLKMKGLSLDSGFSILMPNNYIIMFNLDPEELVKEKLLAAEVRLKEINAIISEKRKGIFQLDKGMIDSMLSAINPMFRKYAMDTKPFNVDDSCTGCGLCERVCNSRTIEIDEDGKPRWGKQCTQCLACLHICPVKAIQHGKGTRKKGRYINPVMKRDLNSLLH